MEIIPVTKRNFSQPYVVVGCMIQKNGKYLLVQEAIADRGTWNQPAGWLDMGEDIISGAKREAEEETGMKIELIGLLGVFTLLKAKGDAEHGFGQPIKFIFAANTDEEPKVDPEEIMDAKWFTLDEIKELKNNGVLRDHDIIDEAQAFEDGKLFPLDVVANFKKQM